MTECKQQRNVGIDLMRFISMLMIVCLHVIGHGGILTNTYNLTWKGEVAWLFETACYCSVNCFALISGYVGIHSKHKGKSIVNLCLQSIFYCSIFTAIFVIYSLLNNQAFSLFFVASSLVPALSKSYWYLSAYFCLFFFMPILDKVIDMPRPILKRAGILFFIVFCCISQIIDSVTSLADGYSFLWLAFLYVIGGYISKYNPFKNISAVKSFLGYTICIAISYFFKLGVNILNLLLDGYTIKGSGILISYTYNKNHLERGGFYHFSSLQKIVSQE